MRAIKLILYPTKKYTVLYPAQEIFENVQKNLQNEQITVQY